MFSLENWKLLIEIFREKKIFVVHFHNFWSFKSGVRIQVWNYLDVDEVNFDAQHCQDHKTLKSQYFLLKVREKIHSVKFSFPSGRFYDTVASASQGFSLLQQEIKIWKIYLQTVFVKISLVFCFLLDDDAATPPPETVGLVSSFN